MITSTSNTKIKHARALQRRKARTAHHQFLLEGAHLIQEAIQAGIQPACVFCAPDFLQSADGQRVTQHWSAMLEVVSESVLAAISDTVTPQGVVAVVPYLQLPCAQRDLVLIVDQLRDPGNLGALLRSAWAVGVSEVLVSLGSADIYNPKVVRAGLGAHFHLPIQPELTWQRIAAQTQGLAVLLADVRGELAYDVWDWRRPSALIIGNEAEGAGAEARTLATQHVSIPMQASAESLNAAVAGSVILFEAARQRRSKEHR